MRRLAVRASEMLPATEIDRVIVTLLTAAAAELDGDYGRSADLTAKAIEIPSVLMMRAV